MAAIICGSLAFDMIMNFEGRFAEHILPEQIHKLNVAFYVPTLRREFGGCAGNMAYALQMLGDAPVMVATLGNDGASYTAHLADYGIGTQAVRVEPAHYTAQAMIMTDVAHNQITAFHPGAMQLAHQNPIPASAGKADIGIIAPDGREAMQLHAQQFAAQGVPFIFDPGQGLPMFSGAELLAFVAQADWVAVNDYEAQLLQEKTGQTLAQLSAQVRGLVVTLGAAGAEVWQAGAKTAVAPVQASTVLDPTGCGDAFRAGLLYGLARDWTLPRCVALGNRLGAYKVAHQGPQNYRFDAQTMLRGI